MSKTETKNLIIFLRREMKRLSPKESMTVRAKKMALEVRRLEATIRQRKWTMREVALIRSMHETLPPKLIAKRLGVTYDQLIHLMSRHGMQKKQPEKTLSGNYLII